MFKSNLILLWALMNLSYGLKTTKPCLNISPVDNFNITAFIAGTWYEQSRYPNEFQNTNCLTFGFKRKGDKIFGHLVGASEVPEDSPDYVLSEFKFTGDKGVIFHTLSFGYPRVSLQFRESIISIDYDRYFISYECKYDEKTSTTNEYAWIILRSQKLDDETSTRIDNFLKSTDLIDKDKLIVSNLPECVKN